MRLLAITLMTVGLLIWFSSVPVVNYLSKNRPTKPISETGQVVAIDNHGHDVYVTSQEKFLFEYGIFAGLLLGLLGGALYARHQAQSRRA